MFEKCGMRFYVFYMILLLLMLFLFSSQSMADTNQSAVLSKSFGPSLYGTDGDIQTLIDLLSKRLLSNPFRADLYYQLAHAYAQQGWHDRAAQYMNQWIRMSNNDMAMKDDHAFMLDEKNDKVLVIDRTTKQVVQKINVGWFPRRIIPTLDGTRLYVTNALSNNVSAINTEEMAVTETIKTGYMPWNGKSSPQGDRIYVTNLRSDNVSVIDIKDNTVLETVKVGKGPWGVAISPDGHRLYISNQTSRDIQVIDTGSYSIVDVINVGTHPRDIALSPGDGKKLYAVDKDIVNDEVEIYVVDLEDARIVNALNVPATDDPILSRLKEMSFEDKLELIGILAMEETTDSIKKPKIVEAKQPLTPDKVRSSDPATSSVPPVTDKDMASEKPIGGPTPPAGTEPLMHAYVKVPTASGSDPVSMPVSSEPEAFAESEDEANAAPLEEDPEQEETILKIIVVVRHDTLWGISLDTYGEANNDVYKAIQAENPMIEDVNKIYVGQKIKLPAINTYTAYEGRSVMVKPKDNLFRLALNNYGTVNERIYGEILKANPRIRDIDLIKVGQKIVLPEIPDIPFKSTEEVVAQI